MIKHLRKRSIFTSLLILSAIFLLWIKFLYFGPKNSSVEDEVLILLESCNQNGLNYFCFKKKLPELVAKYDYGLVINTLEGLFAGKKDLPSKLGTLTCHGPAHILGETAIENSIPFPQILNTCSTKCDYGCLHGAFLAEVRKRPDFLDTLSSFCLDYQDTGKIKDFDSCNHIVGHGLAEIFLSDINQAFETCDKLDAQAAVTECSRGIAMEYLMGSPENPSHFDPTNDDLIAFCSQLPGDHNSYCYQYAGFYALSIGGIDYAKDVCQKVPSGDKEGCYFSLGSMLYFFNRNQPETVNLICRQFGKSYYQVCIKGAIEIFVGEEAFIPKAFELCNLTDHDFKPDCVGFIGDRLEWAWGKFDKERKCNNLAGEFVSICQGI